MNKAILIGRLTRDPELRYTGSNIPVATFSLAVNRPFANQNGERETDFINIVMWRKTAETAKQYLTQGSQIAIEGRIQTRSYDDQDGKKRYITEVVADNFQFLESKASREQRNNTPIPPESSQTQSPSPYNFAPTEEQTTSIDNDPFKDFGEEIKMEDDELPF